MRGMLAGLIVALAIVFVALLVAVLGSLGIAAIGLLLSHWFELTQWQGSLIALAVVLSVGFGVYRIATGSDVRHEPQWMEWDEEEDEPVEPPVVAWRRSRPTQGDLPARGRKQRGSERK